MKRHYLPFLFLSFFFYGNSANAQLVGDNAFLQGQWLEVAVAPNGSWGNTVTVPASYHTRAGSSTSYTDPLTGTLPTGNGMDFSFDQGHDGWATGTTPWVGAYFLPGTPFNGWQVEIDDTMASAFYSSGRFDTAEGGNFGGTVAKYTGPSCWNPRAPMAGIWQGNYGLRRFGLRSAMHIEQVTEVDSFASLATVTTKFFNTSDSVLKNVYYMATADPDNDVTLSGSFPTNNHIAYQGLGDRHEVWARPPVAHQDAFSGLATVDCRAKVLIYVSWPPSVIPGNNLNKVWAGTPTGMGTTYYTLGATTLAQDIAYGLVFNVGNIAPHDSASLTFAWIFADTTAVDSIFGRITPQFSAVGHVVSNGQSDTVIQCNMTGCKVLNDSMFIADVVQGDTREWALSKWTWSPSIGLSTSVGTSATINFKKLSGPVTYTITGTPHPTASGSCRTSPSPISFTLYVQPCFIATNKVHCDTIFLNGTGDTTGATFQWVGPGGYVGTGQSTIRVPSAMTDTGTYMLIKIVGTTHDTAYTHVSIVPGYPTVTAGYNSPLCTGNTLSLTSTKVDPAETYSWVGPKAYASTLQNPSRLNVTITDSGDYRVIADVNGCRDTAFIHVVIDSTPEIKTISANTPICSQKDILNLTSFATTDSVKYDWSGPFSFTSTLQNPSIAGVNMYGAGTSAVGVYTLTATNKTCKSFKTVNVTVDSTPAIPTLTTNAPVCSGTALNFTATTLTGSNYSWSGPIGFTSTVQNPSINPSITANTGIYSVTATFIYPGHSCVSDPAYIYAQVDSTPTIPVASSNSPGPPGASICENDTLKLFAYDTTAGVTWNWAGGTGFSSTDQNPVIPHVLLGATGTYTVTATLGACSSSSVISVKIKPAPPLAATSNSPVCSGYNDSLYLQATSAPGATFSWSGPYTFSSTQAVVFRYPVLTEYDGVYTVTAFLDGCTTTINDTVVVNETPPTPWMKWLTFCEHFPPQPLQAMGQNILWYPNTFSLTGNSTPPVINTEIVGETFYYATQTVKGCTSAKDSMKVTVYPVPHVTISPNIGVCPHDTATLVAGTTDALTYYHWYPAMYLSDTSSPSVIVKPETNTLYTIVASNMFNCSDTGTVYVTVKAGAVLNLGDSVTLYPGEKYQFNPSSNCTYFRWFPSTSLDNPKISNPITSAVVSTKYTVTGVTSWGCKVQDSINVYVTKETLLDLPNAFAPGNGPNSKFKILKRGIATLQDFSIYDRWGVKVFETTNIDEGWDGTYNGSPQPFGVYIYQIRATTNSGEDYEKHGNVTLIR